MKLFKNEVGRPSNETLMLRKVFYMSVAAIAISLVSVIVSVIASENFTNKLKAATIIPGEFYEISLEPDDKVPDSVFPWVTEWEVDPHTTYDMEYTITNTSNQFELYYKTDVNLEDVTNGEVKGDCKYLGIGESRVEYYGPKYLDKLIEYDIRVYKNYEDCSYKENDIGGAKPKYIALSKGTDSEQEGSTSGDEGIIDNLFSFFEMLFDFFVKIFEFIMGIFNETPSGGEPKPVTSTTYQIPEVPTTTTTYPTTTTKRITTTTYPTTTTTKRITTTTKKITTTTTKAPIPANTELVNGYIRVIDASGDYRNGYVQPGKARWNGDTCVSTCNCYVSYFAQRIKKGSSSLGVCGCNRFVYGTSNYDYTDPHYALNQVRDQLLDGNPVLAYVNSKSGGHWIIVIGVKEDKIYKEHMQYTDFLVADPLRDGEDNWDELIKLKSGYRNLRKESGHYRISY